MQGREECRAVCSTCRDCWQGLAHVLSMASSFVSMVDCNENQLSVITHLQGLCIRLLALVFFLCLLISRSFLISAPSIAAVCSFSRLNIPTVLGGHTPQSVRLS